MPLLKKAQIVKGAILEVLPVIKDGLPSFGMNLGGGTKEYLLLTPKPGGFFDGHYKITSGTKLEVVEGPKRRGEAGNSAKVKVVEQPEVEGFVYWCELRASAKLITPAPAA
jgi:hypothetical protein